MNILHTPTVSIIVPNFNHAPFLRKRVDSILGQTYQDFEIILLDDCSTDESRSILREYSDRPHVRLAFNDANSGSGYRQWNKGVSLARGKYVWIAESDDYADGNLLQRLVGDPRKRRENYVCLLSLLAGRGGWEVGGFRGHSFEV